MFPKVCFSPSRAPLSLSPVLPPLFHPCPMCPDTIPQPWASAYSTGCSSLSSWVTDLQHRAAQWASLHKPWLTLASATTPIWLGGLAMPDAFIAATKQAAALVGHSVVPLPLLCARCSFLAPGVDSQSRGWSLEGMTLQLHVGAADGKFTEAELTDDTSFVVTGASPRCVQCGASACEPTVAVSQGLWWRARAGMLARAV